MDEYQVELAPTVLETLLAIPRKDDARKVRSRLISLGTAPHFEVLYDPIYPAARPDHEVLVTYAGHYGIYYVFDDEKKLVSVEYLEDTRRDPLQRFE